MAELVFEFKKYPQRIGRVAEWYHGNALCVLTRIEESASLGDPSRVTWIVKRLELYNSDSQPVVLSEAQMRDFERWLYGQHGFAIAAELRNLHHREQAAIEPVGE